MPEIKKEENKSSEIKPQGFKIEWPKKADTKSNVTETKIEEKGLDEPIMDSSLIEKEASMNKMIIYAALVVIIGTMVIWHYKNSLSSHFGKENLAQGQISDNDNSLGIVNMNDKSLLTNQAKVKNSYVKSVITLPSPYLGLHYFVVTPLVAKENNLTVDYGVLVKAGPNEGDIAVVSGSPADKAGIMTGDVILEIDAIKLDQTTDLATIIKNKKIGDEISLKILREGIEQIIPVTLGSSDSK